MKNVDLFWFAISFINQFKENRSNFDTDIWVFIVNLLFELVKNKASQNHFFHTRFLLTQQWKCFRVIVKHLRFFGIQCFYRCHSGKGEMDVYYLFFLFVVDTWTLSVKNSSVISVRFVLHVQNVKSFSIRRCDLVFNSIHQILTQHMPRLLFHNNNTAKIV